ncbi:MAG: acyl-CoA/acyl-ACP dehydrogenase [Desulfobacterium sp.]|nr:acyl-CoA/acyl-ACP dehydrogenase [Desulfobacterium sp.]
MFELTRLEKEIKKSARDFAKGEFDQDAFMAMSKKGTFPQKLLDKACEIGLMGVHLAEAHGGGGLGIAEQAVILEELAIHDSTAGFALAASFFGVESIGDSGDKSMAERVIPLVSMGKALCATAFYETDVQTVSPVFISTAMKTDSGWILNGTKTNVLNGTLADFFLVICSTRSGENAPPGGCTAFLVDRGMDGVTLSDQGPSMGMGMVPRATLNLENVTVPFSSVIGTAGKGMDQLRAFQCAHWILVAALGVGIAKGAYKRTLDYIKQREQFGKRIADFRVNRHKIADMAVKIDLASLAARRAARSYDAGERKPEVSALARLIATDTAVRVSDEAVQLLGGYGYMAEYEVEHFLRDAKFLELMGGEKSVLLDIIGDKEIGRPKEKRSA